MMLRRSHPPAACSLDPACKRAIRRRLGAWYRSSHRPMPWRARPGALADPYHVLVSETMLQQTQVATVIAYFNRFIEALPTLETLASAPEQQVLRLWQGLGYYRRARHLHAAAKAILTQHAGKVPGDVDALLKLPGIGRYTAGAIASIAFGKPEPLVDGNVTRVLTRWLAIKEPANQPAVQKKLWSLAAELVPRKHPGDFNQALMELGATLCTPRSPQCDACPVASLCLARSQGLAEQIPAKVIRTQPRSVSHHILAVQHATEPEHWLFELRPPRGLWSNLWQMPTAEHLPLDTATADASSLAASQLRDWFHQQQKLGVTEPVQVTSFKHQTTHRDIEFTLWRCKALAEAPKLTWRALDAVDDLPLAKPQLRAVQALKESRKTENSQARS